MTADRTDQCFDEIWLNVSGLRIHCLTAGAFGPAVLLLHGSAFDAAGVSFGSAISALATGCRVFAPDLPGFGESDLMPDGWGFAEYSAFLSPLMTELGLQRASLGGGINGRWHRTWLCARCAGTG
jgi:pimeloyl-ACP methyl ester carboxylesterase